MEVQGNGQQEQPIKCFNPDCGKMFAVFVPRAEVINTMGTSLVIWAHPEPQCCPYCGLAVQMKLATISGAKVAWGPVRTEKDAGIVIPPAGFKLPSV